MATSPASVELEEIGWGKSPIQIAQETVADALQAHEQFEEKFKTRLLLECLTEQILCDGIKVEDARQIVINWSYYRKFRQPLKTGLPKNYESLREIEMRMIRVALQEVNGNVRKAARNLGIARHTLYRRLHEMDTDSE